jgi:hypothetical protein
MKTISINYDSKLQKYVAIVNGSTELMEMGDSISEAYGKAVQSFSGELGITLTAR